MTQTSAFVTHRDIGWKCKSPHEGTSPPLPQDVAVVLAIERSYLPGDCQPIVVHVDSDLVLRDARKFESYCDHVRHRIFEYVHSGISNRVRDGHRLDGDRGWGDADRHLPWFEDAALPGGLGDVMVRTGVAMNRVVVVVRWVHVVVEWREGHGGG